MRRIWLALCFLGLAFVSRAEVPVYAYVVCGTNGTQMAASPLTVSEYVKNLNFVFSQVCIDFQLVHYGVITNGELACEGRAGLVPEWQRGVHGACRFDFFCPCVGGSDLRLRR